MTSINNSGMYFEGGNPSFPNAKFNFGSSPPISPVKQFPYRDNPNFVGREAQLKELHQQLQQPEIVAITAVAGMGGVGKTELASHYSHKHESEYSGGISWLDARGENLAVSIVQFAQLYLKLEVPQQDARGKPLNLTQQVAWCWQNWQPPEGLVLVILDDVTDLAHCRDFFPTSNRFRVLITTRLRHLDTNIREIPLDVLSSEEALQLLTALDPKRVQREPETAQELCKWLGYLPLGIDLVGRHLAKKPPQWTLAKMLERLKTQSIEDEALNQELYKTLSTAQRGVKAAFELSWQELQPQTQQIAEFLSLFAPSMFAWEWVEVAANGLNWHSADVEIANQQLYEHHLIQWVENRLDGYKIHPLIREFLKAKLKISPQAEEVKRVFASIFVAIAETIPYQTTQYLINSVKDAIDHLAEVGKNLLDAVSDENLLEVFTALGRFYKGQGLYASAEIWYTQCVSVLKSRLGEEHPDVATSINNVAYLYSFQGRYGEAESLYQQALELRICLLGTEHPDTGASFNNIAGLYQSQGRYREAESLYQQAFQLSIQLLGEEHLYVATCLNNLAGLYQSQGRYGEAEILYKKALALKIRLLGDEHPDVANSFNNLALLYYCQGRHREAEPLYQQALAMRICFLGEEHPDVATSFNNLAGLYYFQGRYRKAEPLFQKSLAINIRFLGEKHPDVATGLNNLALVYLSQERYEEAEPLLEKAMAIKIHVLGEEHTDVAVSLNSLGMLYYCQRQYKKAQSSYQQALILYKKLLGEEHPRIVATLNSLGKVYICLGQYTEAERLLKQVILLNIRLLGEEHPNIAVSLNSLAYLYFLQQQYKRAESLYQQALVLDTRLLGEEHPNIAVILSHLAALYYFQQRYGEAETLLKQAVKISEKSLGVDHPHTIIYRKNLQFLRDYLNSL